MSKEFDDYIAASNELNRAVAAKALPIAVKGDGYSVSTVTYKKAPALISLVASSGEPIASADIPTWNGRLWPKLNDGLRAAGIQTPYACTYFYTTVTKGRFVLQIGFPVPAVPDPLPGDLIGRRDAEHWCASAVLIGPFIPHIGHAWKAANDHLSKDGLRRSGEDREIYHHMTDFICTEVQIGLTADPSLRTTA